MTNRDEKPKGRPRILEAHTRVQFELEDEVIVDLDDMAEDLMGGNRAKMLRKIVSESAKAWKARTRRG